MKNSRFQMNIRYIIPQKKILNCTYNSDRREAKIEDKIYLQKKASRKGISQRVCEREKARPD